MINWNRISYALELAKASGYEHIDVPWSVLTNTNALFNRPQDAPLLIDQSHVGLIRSAESAFFSSYLKDNLSPGRYVTCVPDYNESGLSVYLFRTDRTDAIALYNLIDDAEKIYRNDIRGIHPKEISRVSTSDGVSIVIRGVVIGTYGVRKIGNLSWVHGTAMKEPAFSTILD